MKPPFFAPVWSCLMILALCAAARGADTPQALGRGDGRIHIIPALSSPSVKNGGKLTIQALVKAAAGVARVEAEIEGVARLELKMRNGIPGSADARPLYPPPPIQSQISNFKSQPFNPQSAIPAPQSPAGGLYQAEWTAQGLEEKVYPVTLRVTDRAGHVFTDRSLSFSDPAAGNSTVGGTAYPLGAMLKVGVLELGESMNEFRCGVIDSTGTYAYFGADTSPGTVNKLRLSDFTLVGSLTLNAGENELSCAVIEPGGDHAYFGTNTSPGRVIKVRLADLARVGALTLNDGEQGIQCAVIDSTGNHAYFGTSTSPGIIVKVQLSDLTRVRALTLNNDEDDLRCAIIDATGSNAYFGTDTMPGKVIQVRLTDFTRVRSLALDAGEDYLWSAVLDSTTGYAYFGTDTQPGMIIKVRVGDLTRVGAITLKTGENYLECAVIDRAGGYAFFGTRSYTRVPGRVVKVRLSDFTRLGIINMSNEDKYVTSATINPNGDYAYFGIAPSLGTFAKVALFYKNTLHANKIALAEAALVTDVRFYSHTAKGNLRLALYDTASPKRLLWQSASTPNTAAGAWLTVPITKGTPATLTLPPGTYWLAWQTDSTADVGSYVAGDAADGFTMNQAYGAFPTTIDDIRTNVSANRWSEYLTYTRRNDAQGWWRYH